MLCVTPKSVCWPTYAAVGKSLRNQAQSSGKKSLLHDFGGVQPAVAVMRPSNWTASKTFWLDRANFAELVEQRIEGGLYRSYIELEENLRFLRGRIQFAEDLRRNAFARQRTYCEYAEFTWDIEENQIIRQVAHLLSGWDFPEELRLRLTRLDTALSEVTPTTLPASIVARFKYNRFNEDYRQIHQLCRLFLEGSSLHEEVGVFDSRAFLIDMNKLFEQFITEILREHTQGKVIVTAQSEVMLGENQKVSMRPDLLVGDAEGLLLVADCKYKRLEADAYKNHDFYQVLSYCIATKVDRGLLIYPLHEVEAEDVVNIRNSDIVIEQRTVNLGVSFVDFRKEWERFADSVFAWAEQPAVPDSPMKHNAKESRGAQFKLPAVHRRCRGQAKEGV